MARKFEYTGESYSEIGNRDTWNSEPTEYRVPCYERCGQINLVLSDGKRSRRRCLGAGADYFELLRR